MRGISSFWRSRVAIAAGMVIPLGICASSHAATMEDTVPNPGDGPWVGYMNWFAMPADGGGYVSGGPWGTADLRASFTGSALTLAPNTNVWETNDTYWVTAG